MSMNHIVTVGTLDYNFPVDLQTPDLEWAGVWSGQHITQHLSRPTGLSIALWKERSGDAKVRGWWLDGTLKIPMGGWTYPAEDYWSGTKKLIVVRPDIWLYGNGPWLSVPKAKPALAICTCDMISLLTAGCPSARGKPCRSQGVAA
jgi:hypothetical protein